MNKYIHILGENGVRITSIVYDNLITEEQFLSKAKKLYPNAEDYIYGDDNSLDKFLEGKVYINGTFKDKPIEDYIPTKAEKILEIKNYYSNRLDTLEKTLIKRQLSGLNSDDLKLQYQKLNSEMLAKIKEVK